VDFIHEVGGQKVGVANALSLLARHHNIHTTNRSIVTQTASVIRTNLFIFFISVPVIGPPA
jgi:hypothetical protein